jgi:hypothetical protein
MDHKTGQTAVNRHTFTHTTKQQQIIHTTEKGVERAHKIHMIALTLKISSKGIVIRALVISWPTVECHLSVITMYIYVYVLFNDRKYKREKKEKEKKTRQKTSTNMPHNVIYYRPLCLTSSASFVSSQDMLCEAMGVHGKEVPM